MIQQTPPPARKPFFDEMTEQIRDALKPILEATPEARSFVVVYDFQAAFNGAVPAFGTIVSRANADNLTIAEVIGQCDQVHRMALNMHTSLRNTTNNVTEQLQLGLTELQRRAEEIERLKAELAALQGKGTPSASGNEPAPNVAKVD